MSICFHAVFEDVASRVMHPLFVKGKNNLAGCFTKLMSGINKL